MKYKHTKEDVLEMVAYAVFEIWCMECRKEQPEVQKAADDIADYFHADKCGKDFIEAKVSGAVCTQEEYAFKNSLTFWLGVITASRQWKKIYRKVRRIMK